MPPREYQELGAIYAGEVPAPGEQVERLVRSALTVNGFIALPTEERAGILVVYSWGSINPDHERRDGGPDDRLLNQSELFDLVGGRPFPEKNRSIEGRAVIEAASIGRYFLIVSAYALSSHVSGTNVMLWRTQISMPSVGISQEQAMPILASAGAALLGRETSSPLFIQVDVERALAERASDETRRMALSPLDSLDGGNVEKKPR